MLDNRFWKKVDKMGNCWYWIACKDKDGYGIFSLNGKNEYAHRVSYKDKFEKIPKGLVINHICRTRHCVNPDHLEVMTSIKNVQIGENHQRHKTHCPQGHEYSEENTYITPKGHRFCRTCGRIKFHQYYQRKKLGMTLQKYTHIVDTNNNT